MRNAKAVPHSQRQEGSYPSSYHVGTESHKDGDTRYSPKKRTCHVLWMYMAQHMIGEHGRNEIQQNHFQAPRHYSGINSVKWVIGSIYSESASSISKSSISFQLWWYRSVSTDTQAPAAERTSLCCPQRLTKARGLWPAFGLLHPFLLFWVLGSLSSDHTTYTVTALGYKHKQHIC